MSGKILLNLPLFYMLEKGFYIENYQDFKRIFGTRNSERGSIYNKVLLAFWIHRYKIDGDGRASYYIRNLNDLYNAVLNQLKDVATSSHYCCANIHIRSIDGSKNLLVTRSAVLNFDRDRCGLNFSKIGYINIFNYKSGHIECIRASRIMKILLDEQQFNLGEAATNYICEEFQRNIEKEVSVYSDLELCINDDFESIYTTDCLFCPNSWHSCMNNRNRGDFYKNIKGAHAASLKTKDGLICARCIYYEEVHCKDNDKIYKYADCIYSCNLDFATILYSKLIHGHVDIIKELGASCRASTKIKDVDGNYILNRHSLYVVYKKPLTPDSTISYQDTFKYVDPVSLQIAYNTHPYPGINIQHLATTYSPFSQVPTTTFNLV